ncbi:protein ARV 2 isoform X2 [Punica granatum]|uniref:Protein ARV n=1 Tax=Punica granatum TaxID=22663 RepID=A0A6P8CY04_PUNGR|nr:protein ARV 2 isoform X2 [Punica granatum]
MGSEATKYRCVQCGHGIGTLFVQYSPGNIRLMKCERCKSVADEYIECELMILLIDLILHKTKAYRHLLYNVLLQETVDCEGLLWKSALGFLALDAYRCLILAEAEGGGLPSFTWICRKIFADVFVGNFILFSVFIVGVRSSLTIQAELSRWKDLMLVILISSYWKIFLFAMMIWEFPSSVVFIVDAFVLSSNAIALKVITDSTTKRCIMGCFAAHAAKFLATQLWKWCCSRVV